MSFTTRNLLFLFQTRCLASILSLNKLAIKAVFATRSTVHLLNLVVDRKWVRREFYFAILFDRNVQGPVLVASKQGGMDIESVAHDTPDAIFQLPVDIINGLSYSQAFDFAAKLDLKGDSQKDAAEQFVKLYNLFIEKDATMIEINPLAELNTGQIMCMDAKFGFDDNAEFRQVFYINLA